HALDVGFADEFFAGRVDGRGAHRKDDCNKPEYFRGASILSITPTSRGFVARTPSTAVPRMLFPGGSRPPTTEPSNSLTRMYGVPQRARGRVSAKLLKGRTKSSPLVWRPAQTRL